MEKERKKHSLKDVAKDLIAETIKDVEHLKKLYAQSPNAFHNEQILATDDGNFIFINGKFVRLDKNFKMLDINTLPVPEIGYEPVADRAVLMLVKRQDQFTQEGMYQPSSFSVQDRNARVNRQRYRFIIVKAGPVFSKMATGDENIRLGKGDEIILADHLDGLPHFPIVEDPTGIISSQCISLHYSEINGYVRHGRYGQEIELIKD